jgi:Cdc6-like AAA superfamily ATPase
MTQGDSGPHPDEAFFRRQAALHAHFRPGAPVDTNDLLKGRTSQIQTVFGAVWGVGEHAAVYGEPGVGKTSLTLVVQGILNTSETAACVRVPCTSEDTFQTIWRNFGEFLERDARRGRVPLGERLLAVYGDSEGSTSAVETGPSDVFFMLDRLSEVVRLVVIIDEFDRIAEWSVRSNMANLIKLLSDERVDAKIIVVGVAHDLEDLVGEHTSIERNLVQIPMPRLRNEELREILVSGFQAAELTWEEGVVEDIAKISKGLPHYVHLMGRTIGTLALSGSSNTVEDDLWYPALSEAVKSAQETISRQYAIAVASHRQDALYRKVLLACALTPGDEWGFFQPSDVSQAYGRIRGTVAKTADFYRHLQAFTQDEREGVLETRGEGRAARYRFHNPLLQPYVILRGLQDGTVGRADLPALPN